jgi:hypothetical protein
MYTSPLTPKGARALADEASEAIRALNHATLPADGAPALSYPADAYYLLGTLQQLAGRLSQLLEQIFAFLQRQLQLDAITINDGEFAGDSLGAIGTASDELQNRGTRAARVLASAIGAAQQAMAFATCTESQADAL